MAFNPPASKSAAAATAATSVDAAVKALIKWKDAQSAAQKPQLLPQDDFIYLHLSLKKIPPKPRTNPFRISLRHPLFEPSSELCLIIDDRPTSNLTSETAKKIVKSQNIPISKVLKLSKLKTNYKPFEAKRKLCDSYDLFLVDRRIVHLLPKLLGKSFFKKKKLPLPLDLTHKNWKEQIERATGCGFLYMRTGTCCVMKVGKMSMDSEEIVENVVHAINGVVEVVPKKWVGVRSLHLKFSESLALPVYQALPDLKFKIEGVQESGKARDAEVGVKEETQQEKKKGKKTKGGILDVRYMDVGLAGDELETDDDKDENEGKKDEDDEFVDADGGNYEEWVNKEDGDEKGFSCDESEGNKSGKSEDDDGGENQGFSSAHSDSEKRKMGKMEGKKARSVEKTRGRAVKKNSVLEVKTCLLPRKGR